MLVQTSRNLAPHHKAVFPTICINYSVQGDNLLKAWYFMRFIMGTDLDLQWGGKMKVIRS